MCILSLSALFLVNLFCCWFWLWILPHAVACCSLFPSSCFATFLFLFMFLSFFLSLSLSRCLSLAIHCVELLEDMIKGPSEEVVVVIGFNCIPFVLDDFAKCQ